MEPTTTNIRDRSVLKKIKSTAKLYYKQRERRRKEGKKGKGRKQKERKREKYNDMERNRVNQPEKYKEIQILKKLVSKQKR